MKLYNRLEQRDTKPLFNVDPFGMLVEFDNTICLLTEMRDEQIDAECNNIDGAYERALEINHAIKIFQVNKERVMTFVLLGE